MAFTYLGGGESLILTVSASLAWGFSVRWCSLVVSFLFKYQVCTKYQEPSTKYYVTSTESQAPGFSLEGVAHSRQYCPNTRQLAGLWQKWSSSLISNWFFHNANSGWLLYYRCTYLSERKKPGHASCQAEIGAMPLPLSLSLSLHLSSYDCLIRTWPRLMSGGKRRSAPEDSSAWLDPVSLPSSKIIYQTFSIMF